MSVSLVLTGQLLGAAFACGLNLYLTVAALGLAARLDLLAELPPGMRGLENGVIIGVAIALYAAESVADRVPGVDHLWEAAHTVIRPAAAGSLVFLALMGTAPHIQFAGTAAATLIALAAHGAKAGIRTILTPFWLDEAGRLRPQRTMARTAAKLLEDAAAAGIALAAILYPSLTVLALAAALILLLVAGPRLWRAAFLGPRAVMASARAFFGRPGWRTRAELPRAVQRAVPVEPLGRSPARALPAAVRGLPRAGAYRHGWLVFTCDGARFVYTTGFGARSETLPGNGNVVLRRGVLADTIELACAQRQITLFLLKDGPPAELAAAELAGHAP